MIGVSPSRPGYLQAQPDVLAPDRYPRLRPSQGRRPCRARSPGLSRLVPTRSVAALDRKQVDLAGHRSAARSPAKSLRPGCSVAALLRTDFAGEPRGTFADQHLMRQSVITARAMLIGCAKPSSAPTAPLRRVVPSMTAASSCNVPRIFGQLFGPTLWTSGLASTTRMPASIASSAGALSFSIGRRSRRR